MRCQGICQSFGFGFEQDPERSPNRQTRGLPDPPRESIVQENDPIRILQRQCHGRQLTSSQIESQPLRRHGLRLNDSEPFQVLGLRNVMTSSSSLAKLVNDSLGNPDLRKQHLNPSQGSDAV